MSILETLISGWRSQDQKSSIKGNALVLTVGTALRVHHPLLLEVDSYIVTGRKVAEQLREQRLELLSISRTYQRMIKVQHTGTLCLRASLLLIIDLHFLTIVVVIICSLFLCLTLILIHAVVSTSLVAGTQCAIAEPSSGVLGMYRRRRHEIGILPFLCRVRLGFAVLDML